MTAPVHILATVRNPLLLDAALLVFKTLRIGFPTAPVAVWGNGLNPAAAAAVDLARLACLGPSTFQNLTEHSHDDWIETLILKSQTPFWICDTDMVFHNPVESWLPELRGYPFAGRLEPEFAEEWTHTTHVARLHTCLMYVDPARTRAAIREIMNRVPELWRRSAQWPLIRQTFVPVRRETPDSRLQTLFYDTMAGLYQAGFGQAFTAKQDEAFDHCHCGTYADLVSPHLTLPGGGSLLDTHRAIYENPAQIKGANTNGQAAYYQSRATQN